MAYPLFFILEKGDVEGVKVDVDEKPASDHIPGHADLLRKVSDLKRQICTHGEDTRPGQEFWDSLYKLCERLEGILGHE
jgi:hypothetical protein